MSEFTFGKSDDEIHQMRKNYAQALREEFEREDVQNQEIGHLEDPASNVEKYTKRFFRENLPDAAAQVVWLMGNSQSDSVRLKAATYVINIAREDAVADGDPLKDLLTKLGATPTAINAMNGE